MKSTIEQVREFHQKFVVEPGINPAKIAACRITLLQEELDELSDAIEQGDVLETLDALTDLQYVLDGTYIIFGLDELKDKAFEEVHRSNMSKLGGDGKPILREDGKILKGPNYFKPNLTQFL